MSSINNTLSTTTTTVIEEIQEEIPTITTLRQENPITMLLGGERLGGRSDRSNIRSLLSTNVTESSSIPAITEIEGIIPLDLPNFSAMNSTLSQEERGRFMETVLNQDQSVINPILSVVPYLTQNPDGENGTILSILFADLTNVRLLSFVNTFVNRDTVQPPSDLLYIVNIWIYFNSSLSDRATELDLNFFVQELRLAFTQVYQYNFFDAVRIDHRTTVNSIQESLIRANSFADENYETARSTIENTRSETNDSINQLSTLANRRQFINTVGFALLNMLLVNQMGFNPITVFNQLQPLLSSSTTPRNELLPIQTNSIIRLRDIYDLALEKFYSFIRN